MVWKNPNKPLGQPMFLEPSPWQLVLSPEDIQSLRKAGLGLVILHQHNSKRMAEESK